MAIGGNAAAHGREPAPRVRFVVEPQVQVEWRSFEVSEIVEIVFAPVEKIDNERAAAEYCLVVQLDPRLRPRLLPLPAQEGLASLWNGVRPEEPRTGQERRTASPRHIPVPPLAHFHCRAWPGVLVFACVEQQLLAWADIEGRCRGEVGKGFPRHGRTAADRSQAWLESRFGIFDLVGHILQPDVTARRLAADEINTIEIVDVFANSDGIGDLDAATRTREIERPVDVALAQELEHLVFPPFRGGPGLTEVGLVSRIVGVPRVPRHKVHARFGEVRAPSCTTRSRQRLAEIDLLV